MIYGIGTDIVEVGRIESSIEKFGDEFAKRILAESEMPSYLATLIKSRFIAKRFAAKEAFSKALGTGLRGEVNLQAITVVHDGMGKPCFRFNAQVSSILNQHKISQQHLSISDEKNIAVAFVVLEKV